MATIRFISDRQNLLQAAKARRLGLEPYILDRIDMYWIEVPVEVTSVGTSTITYVVDVSDDLTWSLSLQYGHGEETDLNYDRYYKIAEEKFKGSEEEAKQKQWLQALKEGGYFDDGRYPGKNTEDCQHCRGRFRKGTVHEHVRYNGRIIPHNYRLYKMQQAAGIEPSWLPSGDKPSLEEEGEIKWPGKTVKVALVSRRGVIVTEVPVDDEDSRDPDKHIDQGALHQVLSEVGLDKVPDSRIIKRGELGDAKYIVVTSPFYC